MERFDTETDGGEESAYLVRLLRKRSDTRWRREGKQATPPPQRPRTTPKRSSNTYFCYVKKEVLSVKYLLNKQWIFSPLKHTPKSLNVRREK